MKNKTYDTLKWIALVLLPAVGSLYFGLAKIWHFPDAETIVGTITLVDTFLGCLLHISNQQYNKTNSGTDGSLFIDEKGAYAAFNGDPSKKTVVNLEVRKDGGHA